MRTFVIAITVLAAFSGCPGDPVPATNPLVGTWSTGRLNDWRFLSNEGEWLRISEDGVVTYVSDESSGTITARRRHTERSGSVVGTGPIEFNRGTACTLTSDLGAPWREGSVACTTEASGSQADVVSVDGNTLVLRSNQPILHVREYTRREDPGPRPQISLAEVAGRWGSALTEEFELQRDGGLDGPPQTSSSWMSVGADGQFHHRQYFKNHTDATLTDLRGTLVINGGSASTSALSGVVQKLRPASDGGWTFTEDPTGVGAGAIRLWVSPDGATLDIWGFRVDTFSRQVP